MNGWTWISAQPIQGSFVDRKGRDCLCEMRVLRYYVENKALFETWRLGKQKNIILWGIKYMWNNEKCCFLLWQTHKPTII